MTESAPEGQDQWLGGRRWTAVAAIAVVLIMLVAALTWWLGRGDSAEPRGAVPGPATPTSGNSTVPGAIPEVTVDNADQEIPTTAPTDVTWQVWHALALPFSASAGPARVKGQVASGFAHTPTGALIAYAQASSRVVAATDPGWRDVYNAMLAPGQSRNDAIKVRAKRTMTKEPAPGTFTQFAGFHFISYTPSDAVIQIASRNRDSPTYTTGIGHMTWAEGDWKLVLELDSPPSKQVVGSLDGFVPWGSV